VTRAQKRIVEITMSARFASQDPSVLLEAVEIASRPSHLKILVVDSDHVAEGLQAVADEPLETKVASDVRSRLDEQAKRYGPEAAPPAVEAVVQTRMGLHRIVTKFVKELGWKLLVKFVADGILLAGASTAVIVEGHSEVEFLNSTEDGGSGGKSPIANLKIEMQAPPRNP
jgi:hypothetical protein